MDMGLGGLVVSRKRGQSIRIGDDIVITIVRISDNAARFHIVAPKSLNIVRTEIAERRTPIQARDEDIADIGRRGEFLEADEVADVKLEKAFINHA